MPAVTSCVAGRVDLIETNVPQPYEAVFLPLDGVPDQIDHAIGAFDINYVLYHCDTPGDMLDES